MNSHSSQASAQSSPARYSATVLSRPSRATSCAEQCSNSAFATALSGTCSFGETSETSTRCTVHGSACSVAALISSLAASPAPTPATPATAQGLTALSPGSGARWPGWFARYNRAGSGWKTPQGSLLEEWEAFSGTWPTSGISAGGYAWERANWAPLTTATACSYLRGERIPTPLRSDCRRGACVRVRRNGKHGVELATALGGRPNPRWTESHLLWWPVGWTRLAPLEADRYQQWQGSHSASFGDDSENDQ